MRWPSWLRHCATSRKVAGSIPDGVIVSSVGSGISVGIASDYRLDGPGSYPGGDEIFRPSRPTLGPTQTPVNWVPGLSRG